MTANLEMDNDGNLSYLDPTDGVIDRDYIECGHVDAPRRSLMTEDMEEQHTELLREWDARCEDGREYRDGINHTYRVAQGAA